MVCHVFFGDMNKLVGEQLKARLSEEVGGMDALVDDLLFQLFCCCSNKIVPFLYVIESLFVVVS